MSHLLLAALTLLTVPLTSSLHFTRLDLVPRKEVASARKSGRFVEGSGVPPRVVTMKLFLQGKFEFPKLAITRHESL